MAERKQGRIETGVRKVESRALLGIWGSSAVAFVVASIVWPIFLPIVALVALAGAAGLAGYVQQRQQPRALPSWAQPKPAEEDAAEEDAAKEESGAPPGATKEGGSAMPGATKEESGATPGATKESGATPGATKEENVVTTYAKKPQGRRVAAPAAGASAGVLTAENLAGLHDSLRSCVALIEEMRQGEVLRFLAGLDELDGFALGAETMVVLAELADSAAQVRQQLASTQECVAAATSAVLKVRAPASEMPSDAQGGVERFVQE